MWDTDESILKHRCRLNCSSTAIADAFITEVWCLQLFIFTIIFKISAAQTICIIISTHRLHLDTTTYTCTMSCVSPTFSHTLADSASSMSTKHVSQVGSSFEPFKPRSMGSCRVLSICHKMLCHPEEIEHIPLFIRASHVPFLPHTRSFHFPPLAALEVARVFKVKLR